MSGRILVVDDIATNRMVLRAKLAAAYYDVIQAENGSEAIKSALKYQPDIILLDVMMPDLDGFETCKALKSDQKTSHIPVVMITSVCQPADRLRGLECGADDFLTKPIDDLALFARVRNLLRSKFMLDELRLRDRTTQELGLAEFITHDKNIIPPKARVTLIPSDYEMGLLWEKALSENTPYLYKVCENDTQPQEFEAQQLPDVYVIHARIGAHGDGLRLVSMLRSRPRTRNSAIILVVSKGDNATAAKGLDLGANDYIFDHFDPLELVARLTSQIKRKQISDRLRSNVTDTLRLAVLDPLTGLYNRRYAEQHLGRIAERAQETGKQYALMLLDIDNFKRVNDTYGHASGDAVLKEFSRRIQENLRGVDLVSRLGGEEFLVAMPETSEAQARLASERLRQVIEETVFQCGPNNGGLQITVSIGVTLGDPLTLDVDKLVSQADHALYASKSEGRNMVTLFNSAA
jgi:two-component system cell cycle response regulator